MAANNSTQQTQKLLYHGQPIDSPLEFIDAINMRLNQAKAMVEIWGKGSIGELSDASPEFAASAICDLLSEADKIANAMFERLQKTESGPQQMPA